MMIIGVDYHPSFQQTAFLMKETGEYEERQLNHSGGEAERFYRDLHQRRIGVRVGMEATGYSRWFERLLAELGFELWIGDPAEIEAKRVKKRKTDREDARLLLKLMLEDRFPRIWVPSPENRDLRQLLWHRHRLVQMRTRIMNQLQALAMNEGKQWRSKLWSERGRKAKEIVERSGANSEQRFNRVVLGETTFRKQAEIYLHWAVTRDREPIKDAASVNAAFNKWILPAIGDMPLSNVNNITIKPLVDKMKKSLSARTVNKYVEYVQQVVASLKDGETGEPIHKRKWDSTVMDLPVVNQKEQRRPSLKAKAVNQLVKESKGQEQALYVLLGATGMRISEALALENKHFTSGWRTIEVRQQVGRDTPRVVSYLKTDAAYRDIDLHPDVAEFLQRFVGDKDGLVFATRNRTPHLHNNIEDRWLTARLKEMGLDEPGMGWHAFRRFRKTWLRGKRCQEDINNFWMGHKPKTLSEIYSHLFEEVDMRLAEAEAVGFGFDLPKNPSREAVVAPIAPKVEIDVLEEVAVSA